MKLHYLINYILFFIVLIVCNVNCYKNLLSKKISYPIITQNESVQEHNKNPLHLINKKNDMNFNKTKRNIHLHSIQSKFENAPPIIWKGLMLFICLVWATNFAIIKQIFDVLPRGVLDPSLYTAIRFTIAAAIMSPGIIGNLNQPGLIKNGILAGICIFIGYIGQSIGIMHSTANKAAFFCSLNVVWVALVSSALNKNFKKKTWIAVALAIIGAGFIELKGNKKLYILIYRTY